MKRQIFGVFLWEPLVVDSRGEVAKAVNKLAPFGCYLGGETWKPHADQNLNQGIGLGLDLNCFLLS